MDGFPHAVWAETRPRVLVMGALARNLELAAAVLRGGGCHVECASSLQDFQRCLEVPEGFAVALLDGCNGIESLYDPSRALRTAGIPFVILVPAVLRAQGGQVCADLGAVACLVKPVTPRLLLEVLRQVAVGAPVASQEAEESKGCEGSEEDLLAVELLV